MTYLGPRVLHVVPLMNDGTMPPFIRGQLASLPSEGIQCESVAVEGSRVLLTPRAIRREVMKVRTAVRELDPEIVHAHWGSFLAVAAAIGAGRRPLVITFRGSDLNPSVEDGPIRGRLRNALSVIGALRASAVVTVSEQLAARLGPLRSRAQVIPDGVDLRVFRPIDRAAARAALGWNPAEAVAMLYQGGRPTAKGRPLADASVRRLREMGISARLEVIDGGLTREEFALRLCASDCLLMLSTHEGSPNVVREAIACGIPVVAVDVGDVRQWIEATPGCRLVDRNADSVATAVRATLATPPPPRLPGQAARLGEEASRDALVRVYRSVLVGRGARDPDASDAAQDS